MAKKRINTAAKGRRLEHKTIRVLEAAGYDCTRAAASKGTWDIVAMNEDNLRLIQVKANHPPGPKERQSMAGAKAPPLASTEFRVWKDNVREPLIKILLKGGRSDKRS